MKNKTTYNRAMHDKKHPYTLVSAELINNTDLSGEERFLLIFLLGRSNDYILNSSYYANNAKKLFGWGRDKFYKIWISLQDKGYISKKKIRVKGKIDGEHYTVHEILPQFLKNQNTENPESGKTGIWQTSALPSIDKPIIDEPNTDEPISARGRTRTNQKGARVHSTEPSTDSANTFNTNDQVQQIFDLVCELNPSKYSDNWKMNDEDRELIAKAIDELGFTEAKLRAYQKVDVSDDIPYYSVSRIFYDLKYDEPDIKEENNVEAFLIKNPELVVGFINNELSDNKVEDAQAECENSQQFYDFIKKAVIVFREDAKHWSASDEDLEHCEQLRYCDPNIPLAEKLRGGLKSAFDNDDWRFGQVVYQAITAIETREAVCS